MQHYHTFLLALNLHPLKTFTHICAYPTLQRGVRDYHPPVQSEYRANNGLPVGCSSCWITHQVPPYLEPRGQPRNATPKSINVNISIKY